MRKPSIIEKCKLCNYENSRLVQHLKKTHSMEYLDYYIKFLKLPGEEFCSREGCNNTVNFRVNERSYNKWCSISCSNIVNNAIPEVKKRASDRMTERWKDVNFSSSSAQTRYEGICSIRKITTGSFYIAIYDDYIKIGITYQLKRRMKDLKPKSYEYYNGSISDISTLEKFIKCSYPTLTLGSEYFSSELYSDIKSEIPKNIILCST